MTTPLTDNQPKPISRSSSIHRQTACLSCHGRRAKYDGERPCSRCVSDATDCRIDRNRNVRPGPRRTESPSSSVLALRIRQYERLLRTHGIDLDEKGLDHGDDLMSNIVAASITTEDSSADARPEYVDSPSHDAHSLTILPHCFRNTPRDLLGLGVRISCHGMNMSDPSRRDFGLHPTRSNLLAMLGLLVMARRSLASKGPSLQSSLSGDVQILSPCDICTPQCHRSCFYGKPS